MSDRLFQFFNIRLQIACVCSKRGENFVARKRGSTLIIALIVLVVLGALTLALFLRSQTDLWLSGAWKNRAQASELADSGLAVALTEIRVAWYATPLPGAIPIPISSIKDGRVRSPKVTTGGKYTYSIATPSWTSNENDFLIRSVGIVGGFNRSYEAYYRAASQKPPCGLPDCESAVLFCGPNTANVTTLSNDDDLDGSNHDYPLSTCDRTPYSTCAEAEAAGVVDSCGMCRMNPKEPHVAIRGESAVNNPIFNFANLCPGQCADNLGPTDSTCPAWQSIYDSWTSAGPPGPFVLVTSAADLPRTNDCTSPKVYVIDLPLGQTLNVDQKKGDNYLCGAFFLKSNTQVILKDDTVLVGLFLAMNNSTVTPLVVQDNSFVYGRVVIRSGSDPTLEVRGPTAEVSYSSDGVDRGFEAMAAQGQPVNFALRGWRILEEVPSAFLNP